MPGLNKKVAINQLQKEFRKGTTNKK